ncbi:BCCT family transporter, partial [Staphylococcus hominis]|uniref:BCCT family transporter n=1 Tax=Staphylococcus hominis TaxID=1290 RepID=UPI0037095BC5
MVYWGVMEWGLYYQVAGNGGKGMSDEGVRYGREYGMLDWGGIGWAIYVLAALAIG